ncbi:Nramp family divalent metal transporter [Carboxydothermus pertinax]|uniref:Mn2+/Fe2_transporter NRAMP family n=1 Tax=Carboxydothermus pertinax TaxID=870242 RepID=A0A1L8CRZ4_9THEO|nr:Nramp family divalent metal transporter [Carboxydothermus pertinax]GAV21701.1 Mn2+/Fe2_ transporter NRAMP family [Carboxydothermus pertinax]
MAKKKHYPLFLRNLLIFLAILGPGIITGSVDNDPGGITTYSVAGATYGYKILWTLIPAFIVLVVVQEMNARMGIYTGKGLADLIRENTGVKTTFFIFLFLLLADIGNTATEFAGVAGSLQIFGLSKYLTVPLIAVVIWIIVVKGNYRMAEKIFLVFSLFLLSYVISAVMAKPSPAEIVQGFLKPSVKFDAGYISLVIGIIGTTVAPWMQFYMQSAVIEKGLRIEDYKYSIWDVILGGVATIVVAAAIIIACAATLYPNHIKIDEAKDAALALKPFAGPLASYVFAFGLFISAVFAAIILPLSTAFYVCEAFGFEAGIDKSFQEAPEFYTLFTAIIVIAVGIILIPNAPLITITLWTQILNGILLPVVLICMMLIVNNVEVMGEFKNKFFNNLVGWVTVVVLIGLTVFLLLTSGLSL